MISSSQSLLRAEVLVLKLFFFDLRFSEYLLIRSSGSISGTIERESQRISILSSECERGKRGIFRRVRRYSEPGTKYLGP